MHLSSHSGPSMRCSAIRPAFLCWFLTQMCARFSPQQVSHAVERGCGCARARESAVKSSIAQSTAACMGPAFGGGPARRQPVPPQGAEALAFTGQRTMNTRGTRPGLSPTFYRWAEPSLTVQPLGTGRPLVISGVYRGPDFPRACSSSPDTDGVLQPRKSMTMFDLLAMEPAKAAPIPERNPFVLPVDAGRRPDRRGQGARSPLLSDARRGNLIGAADRLPRSSRS